MKSKTTLGVTAGALLGAVALTACATTSALVAADQYPALAPLPEIKFNQAQAELGRYFFFDSRLSGDAAIACASCHDPKKGWGDGMALSKGYPASEYFRNSPTLINAGYRKRFLWDGRLDGSDAGTLVRDMITEAHTMNADARLVQERIKQVPEYVEMWGKALKPNDDPNGMRIFNIVGEFIKSLRSKNVPFDRFAAGDASALSDAAQAGLALFNGKAQCISCHNGPTASDGQLHKTGVPENPEVWNTPLRAITMLRHYSSNGMPNYMKARTDLGAYAITKDPGDKGKFNTPSLRELKYTAPYMHNGMLATLDKVVDFYDKGGGPGSELKPLGLSGAEKKQLVAFLESLSGDPVVVEAPAMPDYKVRAFGKN
ncbi:MAG: photosynthetic protein synthase I [Magnetococcales bacterium]|nr:photosynthetic protein synthase I [Magnetococcales bacterium]